MRTPDWRYTVWLNAPGAQANFGAIRGQELYDHSLDPPASSLTFDVETYNLASVYPDVCSTLFALVSQRYNVGSTGRRRLSEAARSKRPARGRDL